MVNSLFNQIVVGIISRKSRCQGITILVGNGTFDISLNGSICIIYNPLFPALIHFKLTTCACPYFFCFLLSALFHSMHQFFHYGRSRPFTIHSSQNKMWVVICCSKRHLLELHLNFLFKFSIHNNNILIFI